MDLSLVFQKLAIALGLGLLVGLQRERAQSPLAGIRTFPLITLLGAVSALLAPRYGGWVVALGFLSVAAILISGNLIEGKAKLLETGVTTEMAALLMYGVGAYLVEGYPSVAIALGGSVALLLYWKAPLHRFVARIGETDVNAIMRLVLVALVIFPVLPDQAYGPYGVLNPHQIWLMVVLIVGISLLGYVAYKLFGERSGTVVSSILGGLISSTAATVSFARRTRTQPGAIPLAALGIVVASAASLARVIAEVAVVGPSVFWEIAPVLGLLFGWMVIVSLLMYYFARGEKAPLPRQENPAELRLALLFAGLFAVVMLAVAWAQEYFGASGLYVVAFLSGLHDLDAITLSTVRFVDQGQLDANLGWRLILTATLTNLVLKGALAGLLGQRRLLAWLLVPFSAILLVGLGLFSSGEW